MIKREREVIELIAEGLSNKEIAQRLNIETYTVKQHPDKLALHTRLQVASHAPHSRKLQDPVKITFPR